MNDKLYFAAEAADKIGSLLVEKAEDYYRSMDSTGMLETINSSLRCYFGGPYNSTGGNTRYLTRGGKYGQLKKLRVNHLRNIGLHILQLATPQRPAPQPVAINPE